MAIDLKPCPFCGGKATLLMRTYALPSETHLVYCKDCKAEGQPCSTEAEAVEAWNRRKTPPPTRCLACDETIDLGPLDKASTRYICDKCKAAIRWARHRMDAERGRTNDDRP